MQPTKTTSKSLYLLPRRLILVRHGESEANVDRKVYSHTPDWRISLTALGKEQAVECGRRLRDIVQNERLYLYVSPYRRAHQTLSGIKSQLSASQIIGEREDERLREQEMGNYQPIDSMEATWKLREEQGRFFFRFPGGESGADVCDRVSLFLHSVFRERRELMQLEGLSGGDDLEDQHNVVIVCHGLFLRLFIARWYKIPLEVFEKLMNPPNCAIVVLERDNAIGRLVMREEDRRLFGDDPELQQVKFDGTENWLWYQSHLLEIQRRVQQFKEPLP